MNLLKPSLVIVLLIFIIFSCFNGCKTTGRQETIVKNGKQYGVTKGIFRHKWWNYYERGLSFSDGQFWQKAEDDFNQALKRRKEDQFRARTYGMHFVDYFPHRELGISMFHQKRYTDAIKELESSLLTQKTAKAEYYLDKARKSWIEKEKSDIKAPEVSIISPEPGSLSNQSTISVSGIAKDDTYVKSIRVNNIPVRIDVSAKEISFKADVSLKSGENEILVKAVDLTGKTGQAVHKIICDRAGPILNIDKISADTVSKTGYTIKGYSYDDSGIKSIQVNGLEIINKSSKEALLNKPVPKPLKNNTYTIIAEDILGNRTRAEIPVTISRSDKEHEESNPVLLASLDTFPMNLKLKPAKNKPELKNLYHNKNSQFYTANRGIAVSPRQLKRSIKKLKQGTNFALIIGINSYDEWSPLKTAVNDAVGLSEMLIKRYGYLKENVLLKTEKQATRQEIIKDLRTLAGRLNELDNLMIYFAGHGQLDNLTSDGYWIPVEGALNDPTTWIVNSTIQKILSAEKVIGKNIVVIADSCYSGNLLRGGGSMISDDRNYLMKILELAEKKSRQIVTSGGNEPVADAGRDNHSLFAYYFLKALEDNKSRVIDIESLINREVWNPVTEKGGQRPLVGRLKTPMDENGQFILILDESLYEPDMDSDDVETAQKQKTEERALTLISQASKSEILPDTEPPELTIKGFKDEKTVFLDKIYIQGNAKDDGGIQNLTINDKKVLRRPGRNVWFNHLADLEEGKNEFVIKCTDAVGNVEEQKITVQRKIPEVFGLDARMSVALVPFSRTRSPNTGIHNSLYKYLVKSKRFKIKEWKSELTDQDEDKKNDEIKKIAKDLEVDFVLIGTLNIKEKSLEIGARMIEVDTFEALSFEDVYGEDVDKQLKEKLCDGLVLKLCDSFPIIEGEIVKVKRNRVILNVGEKNNIKKGMRLIFFEKGEILKDPKTGEELGADIEELGIARIDKFMGKGNMSQAKPFEKDILEDLEAGLSFVTQ